jgi:hypothetical protein
MNIFVITNINFSYADVINNDEITQLFSDMDITYRGTVIYGDVDNDGDIDDDDVTILREIIIGTSTADDRTKLAADINGDKSVDINDVTYLRKYLAGTYTMELMASGMCGDDVCWSLNSEGILYIYGTGAMTDYSSAKEAPWYIYKKCIFSLVVENGVTSIGDCAFEYYETLNNVTISDSVESIGTEAFSLCENLLNVDFPESTINIKDFAFQYCYLLTIINLNSGVIGNNAFFGCKNLSNVSISEGITSIGIGAFGGCRNLSLIDVSSSNNYYKSIDGVLFTKDGTRLVLYPNGKSDISYVVPDGVLYIEDCAFEYCSRLEDVKLPNGLLEIGNYAFEYFNSLKSINMPSSITSIGSLAFLECTGLENLYIDDIDNWCEISFSDEYSNPMAYATELSINNKLSDELIIDYGVLSINNYAFCNDRTLTSIEIPNSVTSIGSYAFYNCSSLANIEIPNSVTYIDWYTFYNCSCLTNVEIPSSVTSIANYAFWNCNNLSSIVLPAEVLSVNSLAFFKCSSLKTVYYRGNETDWNNVDISVGNEYLTSADIVYLYQNDNTTEVNISTNNILGGVEVSLKSDDAHTIYYTTDGTTPTTRSKVYRKEFSLTEAGNYIIRAMAYNGTAYSRVYEKSVSISTADLPSISYKRGTVTITGEEGVEIYYNKSLTTPTLGSLKYSQPFAVFDNTYVSAIATKKGYANSSMVSLYCNADTVNDEYEPLKDSYNFLNSRNSFGYGLGYKIPINSYTSVFGETLGELLYNENAYNDDGNLISWGGSCFGMALTSVLFYTKGLDLNNYCDSDYGCVYDVDAPKSANSALTKLIERCQVSQFLPIIQMEMFGEKEEGGNWVQSGYGDLSNIVNAAQNCKNEPIIIYISRGAYGQCGHAVLPYRTEKISDDIYNIYVYDCNSPSEKESAEHYITINLSTNKFSYYNGDTYDFAISFIKLSSLLENETVSLLENEDTEDNPTVMSNSIIFITNSDDISIYNGSGVEASNIIGAVHYKKMDIEKNDGAIWLLPYDNYTAVNNSTDVDKFEVKIGNDEESYSLATDNLSSKISFGRNNDKLYISAASNDNTNMEISTYNSLKKKNNMKVFSNYVYVRPYDSSAVEVYTNTKEIIANDINFSLYDYNGNLVNAKYMVLISKNEKEYVNSNVEVSVISKPKFVDGGIEGTLKVSLINNGEISESGTLYTALYDGESNKILSEQSVIVDSLSPLECRNIKFNENINLDNTSKKYVFKIMFWDKNMKPISDYIELYY